MPCECALPALYLHLPTLCHDGKWLGLCLRKDWFDRDLWGPWAYGPTGGGEVSGGLYNRHNLEPFLEVLYMYGVGSSFCCPFPSP